jgi:DNA-binding winged helix-turn-helix (wHTH) protein
MYYGARLRHEGRPGYRDRASLAYYNGPIVRGTGENPNVFWFGPFRLNIVQRILCRDSELVALPPKAVDILIVLVQSAGEVVSRETLFHLVWQDAFVVESTLNKHISILRKALDGGRGLPSCIETVPKRGYRFVAAVRDQGAAPDLRPLKRWTFLQRVVAGVILLVIASFLSAPKRVARLDAARPEADRQYREGRYLWSKLDRAELPKALQRFQKAAASDPSSAQAQAGMADTYAMMTRLAVGNPSANLARARNAAQRALALNAELALPHASLGLVRALADFNFRGAEREYQTALRLDRDSLPALHGYACLLSNWGRFPEARKLIRRLEVLAPVAPWTGISSAKVEWYEHRFERAAAILRDVLDLEPSHSIANYYMAMSLGMLGRTEEALGYLKRSRLNPSVLTTSEAWLHARAGDLGPIRALLNERRALLNSGRAKPAEVLMPAIDAGEKDLALWCLDEMWKTRAIELVELRSSPRFDALRDDPRFEGLIQRIWRN